MEWLLNLRPLKIRCRGSLTAIMTFLLSAASGGVGLADTFTESMDRLSKQNVSEVGRDAMVSAYERLLRVYPDHPDRAKAMLELQGLWLQSTSQQVIIRVSSPTPKKVPEIIPGLDGDKMNP